MLNKIATFILTAAITLTSTQIGALSPLPTENPDEICRQIYEIESTGEALIKEVLRAKHINRKTKRLHERFHSQMSLLAFGWDTVVPFQADDLDSVAIAASNLISIPHFEDTIYQVSKGLKNELVRLLIDYDCS